jgi:hypothetical protein
MFRGSGSGLAVSEPSLLPPGYGQHRRRHAHYALRTGACVTRSQPAPTPSVHTARQAFTVRGAAPASVSLDGFSAWLPALANFSLPIGVRDLYGNLGAGPRAPAAAAVSFRFARRAHLAPAARRAAATVQQTINVSLRLEPGTQLPLPGNLTATRVDLVGPTAASVDPSSAVAVFPIALLPTRSKRSRALATTGWRESARTRACTAAAHADRWRLVARADGGHSRGTRALAHLPGQLLARGQHCRRAVRAADVRRGRAAWPRREIAVHRAARRSQTGRQPHLPGAVASRTRMAAALAERRPRDARRWCCSTAAECAWSPTTPREWSWC